MKELTKDFIHRYLRPDEGELRQIYGKVKQGKTLYATRLAWADLMRGQTVIANWQIFWEGFDERKSIWKLFLHMLRIKKVLLVIPKENFIYLDPTKPLEEILGRIAMTTDAVLYLDEGHRYFDSYLKTNMNMQNREIALLTAHFDRTINIITQRPTAVHVSLRGNVNRFYKVIKHEILFGLLKKFYVLEIQDMIGESPDEENPEGQISFWGRKKWFKRYNYKSMRGDTPRSQPNYARGWILNPIDIFKFLWSGEDGNKLEELPHELKTPSAVVNKPPKSYPQVTIDR